MTERETQCKQVLQYLHDHGSITQLDAEDSFGCRRLAARINDLKTKHGVEFDKEMVTVLNRYGKKCRVAKYWRVS